jgi:hypothetical protein
MSKPAGKLSIHTKKYHKVVLEEIDSGRETTESFSIKLSMRTRTPLPRVRQVLKRLPYTIKSGLSSSQANKLKSVLESIGGRARVETHFVTPGHRAETSSSAPSPGEPMELVLAGGGELLPCPSCGWEEESGTEFCSFCQQFLEGDHDGTHHPDPRTAPETPTPEREAPQRGTLYSVLSNNVLLIVAGILMILLFILIFKQ